MPKRKYWTRSQAKRARISSETETTISALPPELLQQIFGHLPFDDLLSVRETCHLWRDAVGRCPALRDKFRLVYPHGAAPGKFKVINRGYKPPPTVPASTVAFKCDHYLKIGYIGSWWPQVAATVTCLSFSHCQIPVTMLRHTPNLQLLELQYVAQIREARGSEPDDLDFELSHLKKLSLKHSSLGHLSRMITQLKVLECYTHERSADTMVEFVQSKVKNTIEDLILEAPRIYLEEFTKLTLHGLKRVSMKPTFREADFGNMLVQFARLHPSIEDITVPDVFDDKVLNKLLQALPKLKRLNLKLNESGISQYAELPAIPDVLPHLESLRIEWKTSDCMPLSGPKLRIRNVLRFPMLRELHLETVSLAGDSLGNVLRNSPHLHSMTLHECDFDSWHQLLQLITQPVSLRNLKLTSFHVHWFEDEPFHCQQQPLASLRCLELGEYMGRADEHLHELFHLFPQLTELRFGPRVNVDDGLVLEMCQTLTQLERLTVHSGCTTHASTDNVKRLCRNLKHFTLQSPYWNLEKDDFVYFSKHLQSFTYRGIDIKAGFSDDLLSCIVKLLDLMVPLWDYDSDNESDM